MLARLNVMKIKWRQPTQTAICLYQLCVRRQEIISPVMILHNHAELWQFASEPYA